MTNAEIVDIYLKNGLIDKCVDCQFAKLKEKGKLQYKEDFKHDMILELLTYDKLEKIHEEKKMNCFLTRVIQNNIFSNTSWFYRRYIRFDIRSEEIGEKERNIGEGEV